mgnify:CR=1 FL=1
MPVPIILTSNKSDFSNYFSDNITFPKNAEMALTKAVMALVEVNGTTNLIDCGAIL